jgi:hypothetical protein
VRQTIKPTGMKKVIIVSVTLIVAAVYSGCYYDKAELVYPAGCDTVNMKYSANIVPILSANCYVCHGGAASGSGGRKFDDHALLLNYVNSGKLVKAVSHLPGATPMPYNQPMLPQCSIDKIVAWVNRGAPNN